MRADYANYILATVEKEQGVILTGSLLAYVFDSDTERTEWLIDHGLRLHMAAGRNGTGSDELIVTRSQCQPTSTSSTS